MQKRIYHRDRKLSYQIFGEGPVVVLLHGFGENSSVWTSQFHAFPGFKLIIPDLPGSGESEVIEDMSMDGMAESVHVILQKEETRNSIILGHSMGGYITLALVELYGELVAGFGLIHSTAFADSEEKKEIRQKGIQFIKSYGSSSFLRTTIPNLYSHETGEKNKALILQHIERSKSFSDSVLIAYYHSMMTRPDRSALLKNTKKPVIFIFGCHDAAIHLEEGLKQSHMPQLSYIHILEHSGHMGMQEEAEKTNIFLLQFFTDAFNLAKS
jgi:pimeloyl-ACP methyl ester carboxylesterase